VKGRTRTWIAPVPVAASVLPAAASLPLRAANEFAFDLSEEVFTRLAFAAFGVVGAVIVARQSQNVIGWLCCAIGVGTSVFQFIEDYGMYALLRHLPGGVALTLLGLLPWPALISLMVVFLPMLFPNGRLVSPRWRPVAWTAAAVSVAACVPPVLRPGPLFGQPSFPDNPLGIEAVAASIELAEFVAFAIIGLLAILAAASIVVRFRRASGVERQQLKWFSYAVVQLAMLIGITSVFAISDRLPGVLFGLSIALVPAALGIAVLRYRLYDIDRLINRTLVYALLTALLAGVYTLVVLVGGQLFGGLGDQPPSWAVAGATLAVAALFQPARRRIQQAVDRRFNRRRYDASRTVEAFSARLRDQVDLDTLAAELLTVVDQTIQPTTASLWLRQSAKMP
jgi:hypothetical protein